MKGFMTIFFLLGIFSVATLAQSTDKKTAQQLMRLEEQWAAAYLKHDTATIAKILADEYVGIDGRDIITNKTQEIEEAKGTAPGTSPSNFVVLDDTVTDMHVRVYGNMEIVNGRSIEKVRSKDKEATIQYRRTTVWVKRSGLWQCVSFHG